MTSIQRALQPRTREDLLTFWPGTALEAMGVELDAYDSERLTLKLEINDGRRTPAGLLHGGISLFLIESAAGVHATLGTDLSRVQPVGIEVGAIHIRAGRGERIHAEAVVVHRTRTHIFHEVKVLDSKSGELLSSGRVTHYFRSEKREARSEE